MVVSLPADLLPIDWCGFCSLWTRIGMLHKFRLNLEHARGGLVVYRQKSALRYSDGV